VVRDEHRTRLGQLPSDAKRLLAHHVAGAVQQPLASLVQMLRSSTQTPFHDLWPDELSILDTNSFEHSHMHSARQLTDLYLLALAVKRKGRLVSFDQRMPLSAVVGADPKHLVLV